MGIYAPGIHIICAPWKRQGILNLAGADLKSHGFKLNSSLGSGIPKLHVELGSIAKSDIVLVFLQDLPAASWLQVGFAMAVGVKLIGIGKDPSGAFDLTVPVWEDLKANRFLLLGSGRFQKES